MTKIKKLYKTISGNLERFLYSYAYIALVTLIGACGFIYKQEFNAIVIITIILSIQWIFVKDILPSLLGAMILGMVPLAIWRGRVLFTVILDLGLFCSSMDYSHDYLPT